MILKSEDLTLLLKRAIKIFNIKDINIKILILDINIKI